MNSTALQQVLNESHTKFVSYISQLSDSELCLAKNSKWSPAQQLEHIHISVKTVRQALIVPKFCLKFLFGTANRPSKSYEDLVKKYLDKLQNGGRASGRFVPKPLSLKESKALETLLIKEVSRLCKSLEKLSEAELDLLILPHPLLGKLTLREMMYFTIYHVQHHQQLTERDLKA
jgi:hypothetical protein